MLGWIWPLAWFGCEEACEERASLQLALGETLEGVWASLPADGPRLTRGSQGGQHFTLAVYVDGLGAAPAPFELTLEAEADLGDGWMPIGGWSRPFEDPRKRRDLAPVELLDLLVVVDPDPILGSRRFTARIEDGCGRHADHTFMTKDQP
ncbi:MAG: hypothetical protein AAGA48_00340 [Myxococcota bacterium]